MPRFAFVTALVTVAACGADPAAPPDHDPASVRELLAADGATLAVAGPSSSGAIVARLFRTGWEDNRVELAIGAGDLALSTDAVGRLVVEGLAFDLAPIALSAEVFDEPTRLIDLHVELAADPAPAALTWADAEHATAAATIALRLSWSLEVGDRVTPLGPVVLSGLPVAVTIDGAADRIDAALALDSSGTLWSWAGLIELADLSLSIAASVER